MMNRLTYKVANPIDKYEQLRNQCVYVHKDNTVSLPNMINKLGQLEDLMEKYEIEDLIELEIALDQYYHRYDNVQTRRVEK